MKVILKDEKASLKKGRTALYILELFLLSALLPASYFLPRMLIKGKASDFYSAHIFPVISFVPLLLNGIFPTSLTELAVVCGSIALVILLVCFIVKCFKIYIRTDALRLLRYIRKVMKALLITGIVSALIFGAMHGINYNRTSVRNKLHLYHNDEDDRTYEDYEQTLLWAYTGMVSARANLGEDYNGVAHMMTSFDRIVYDANLAVDTMSAYHGLDMSRNFVRVKPVWLSRLWAYTDITGAYDPFLCEANVNTDYLDILHFPVTVCHEICHTKGYASETDANMIAVISLINSQRPDFKYAGYYYIFTRLWGIVKDYAEHEGEELINFAQRPEFEPVARDVRASYRYRDGFNEGPIADFISSFSEDVNNAFLESNGQEGGTDTYIVPQDSYVEYFVRYIRENA